MKILPIHEFSSVFTGHHPALLASIPKTLRTSIANTTQAVPEQNTENQPTTENERLSENDKLSENDVVSPNFINRNPRNLERMAVARKDRGWGQSHPRKDYWHKYDPFLI